MSAEDPQDLHPRKRARLTGPDNLSPVAAPAANGTAARNEKVEAEIEKEVRAGITEYVCPENAGFSGILKQRYTDFLVNEILPNGKVLHLESLQVPRNKQEQDGNLKTESSAGGEAVKAETEVKKEVVKEEPVVKAEPVVKEEPVTKERPFGREEPIVKDESAVKVEEKEDIVAQIPDEDVAILKSIFGGNTTSSILSLHRAVLKSPERKARDFNSVTSEILPDKEQRTNAHQAIRRIFSSRLETITEKDETITIKALPPKSRGNRAQQNGAAKKGGKGNKMSWEELGGEYLHFTLYKENKDTMEVVFFIGSQLKLQPKSFQFAGTKDRRGVTVQRVSARRVNARTMYEKCRNLWNAKVGDYSYHTQGLELGELLGNEFVITLRDCHFPGEEGKSSAQRVELANSVLSKAIRDFKEKGFINYYGLQRFGSFAASTDTIGVKLLQDDVKGAIDHILDFNPDALAAAQDPNSTMMVSSDDKARAEALNLWKTTGKSAAALEKLPRKFSAENSIIRHLGFVDRRSGELLRRNDFQGAIQAVPRNLRLMYVHAYQSFVWNMVAGRRWTTFGSQVIEGDLVLVNEHKERGAPEVVDQTVDQAGEVIIKPSGDDSAAMADDVFERARPLSKEEAESGEYSIFDVVLPLPGFDVEYPPNAIGDFYKEFMKSERGGGLDPHDMRRKWRDISLSGSYRKLLARPGEGLGFEVKAYVNEDEQMVETDLERLQKKGTDSDSGLRNFKSENGIKEESNGDVKMEDGDEKVEAKVAVILRLQLGSSQYATMALRELMKLGGVKAFKPEYGAGR
ncbi:tRNA pseudouridine synthase D [Mytilinidion resinicola]|uniref:tRNA pseudouridine synthase D n=1 Tax=Mytilinidion resinicola TaxID=574789 RepID=A0A6A6Z5G7_9PEZI|nr:tRNA pseudouridine synthase D [Mytilinidion resinicola]KAF2816270.1 tRNA pseudouridine synthase D [Mytilinidion resinicola]